MTIYFDYENNINSIKHNNIENKNNVWIKSSLNITTTIKNKIKVIIVFIILI